MGTPVFAAASLEALIAAGHDILAVYCQPDKPVGRGMKLTPPPVKQLALSHGLTVHQPTKLRDGVVAEQLRAYAPDCIAVVAYGRILPLDILEIPKHGCINAHASLLPKYRGAAPIQWAVLNGERESGVTTMHMAEGMDTGDMILKRTIAIPPDMTAGELHDELMPMAAELLVETLACLEIGNAPRTPQDEALATIAPMLDKSLCDVDWQKSAQKVVNQIRGLDPWPVATTNINGVVLKITNASIFGEDTSNGGLTIAAGDGKLVCIGTVQAPGGKKMPAADYLRGRK